MTIFGPNAGGVSYNVTANILPGFSDVAISGGLETPTTLTAVPNGNIITSNGGTVSILSALAGANYAVVPGVTGTITIGASIATLTPNTIYVGGTATINSGASLLSSVVVDVDGGSATMANGVVASALSGTVINLGDGGTFSNGTNVANVLTGATINFGPGGGTFVANAGGTLLNLSSTTINGFAANNPQNVIEFQNLGGTAATYSITNGTGNQTITVLDASNNTLATVTIAGTTLNPGTYTPGSPGPLTIGQNGTTLTIADQAVVCFLPGTLIRTAAGEVAIEDIRVGDEVVAFVNGQDVLRVVTWVGSGHANPRPMLPADEAGYPVRILKGAISEGVPHKDLLVTPEHCFFFDGALVPIRMLVNGRSIFYDRSYRNFTFHHIEFDAHSVIYADGMLAESFLDTGNRKNFTTQSNVLRFPAAKKDWARDAAVPLCVDRDVVEPLFRAIEARAVLRGDDRKGEPTELTHDADLHLVTEGGRIIRQARSIDGVAMFMIPSNVSSVRVVSRTARPFDAIGPFVDDRRYLGVLIGSISLQDGGAKRDIDVHLTAEKLSGWDWQEATPCRWTKGNALLPLGKRAPNAIAMLGLQILSSGPYLVEKRAFEDIVLNG